MGDFEEETVRKSPILGDLGGGSERNLCLQTVLLGIARRLDAQIVHQLQEGSLAQSG
jgi:hypothetical protein